MVSLLLLCKRLCHYSANIIALVDLAFLPLLCWRVVAIVALVLSYCCNGVVTHFVVLVLPPLLPWCHCHALGLLADLKETREIQCAC
jgi:hypothetical protein